MGRIATLTILGVFIFSFLIYGKTNTLKLKPKFSKEHTELVSSSTIIQLIPPDNSFVIDTSRVRFGLASEKYNSGMMASFKLDDITFDSVVLARRTNILKNGYMLLNDLNVVWYKLASKDSKNPQYNWLVHCEDDFAEFYISLNYDKKFDKELESKIMKTLKSIVLKRNPNVTPDANTLISGDFNKLSLQFVKKLSQPIAFFTEDGKPPFKTKGNKFLALIAPPITIGDTADYADKALYMNYVVLKQIFPNYDSAMVEKVEEYELDGLIGIKMEGSFELDTNKRFIMYYAQSRIAYGVLAICDAKDYNEFKKEIDAFTATVTINRVMDEFFRKGGKQ